MAAERKTHASPNEQPDSSRWYLNRSVGTSSIGPHLDVSVIRKFHRHHLPKYSPTRLVRLPQSISHELGLGQIFAKEESLRAGLPSFKILGASWAIFKLLVLRFNLDTSDPSIPLDAIRACIRNEETQTGSRLQLVTATDGNHGRAVAVMARLVRVRAIIFVPKRVGEGAVKMIRDEGAEVILVDGDYDRALYEACKRSSEGSTLPDGSRTTSILVQDSYVEGDAASPIPGWIVDGYSTIFSEVDEQLDSNALDMVVVPAGVGSLAHAAVQHYRHPRSSNPAIFLVEPTSAPCINSSLHAGRLTSVLTKGTIMEGLNCGTPSTLSFPDLKAFVDASVVVDDSATLKAMGMLKDVGIDSGPCGAATLAGLYAVLGPSVAEVVRNNRKDELGLDAQSVVVLVSTEGRNTWEHRQNVTRDTSPLAISDPVKLAQALVRISSPNPDLSMGSEKSEGENAIASYVRDWLLHHGFEVHWLERTKGRPSVVGVAPGSHPSFVETEPRPKSILLTGHLDTVSLASYNQSEDPLSGAIKDGKLYGRGTYDMKAGMAAFLAAAYNASLESHRGDIIVACVADEEYSSLGTREILEAGWRADGAIVPEPTDQQLALSHRGFVWVEVVIHGVAAHGSRPDLGVDAIAKAGYFLVEIDKYAQRLSQGPRKQKGSVHASLVKGGEEPSSYPATCHITLERRTIEGETIESVQSEIEMILSGLSTTVPGFQYTLKMGMSRPPFSISSDHPLVQTAEDAYRQVLNQDPVRGELLAWTDCALLHEAGVPALLFGPKGFGAHGADEWAEVQSIMDLTDVLTKLVQEWCK
ncbi:uncharacterized protein EI90DRAFT_2975104 [Cantharellus anzutake]|uniref:uncharacterized protein n=1 Tax=Cantharellus anzutake TaxID=1750568 RepID=UPI001905A914|nr:uncharacterized protein EI90DRAFT_2975104 [Cantharellus anzutake]KAF8327466.1 hypothetical protein EI90DRAFT_2975104 [Cantharellus anzutake]